jgi:hypothetical protein
LILRLPALRPEQMIDIVVAGPADAKKSIRRLRPTVQPNCCRPCPNAVRRVCPSASSDPKLWRPHIQDEGDGAREIDHFGILMLWLSLLDLSASVLVGRHGAMNRAGRGTVLSGASQDKKDALVASRTGTN